MQRVAKKHGKTLGFCVVSLRVLGCFGLGFSFSNPLFFASLSFVLVLLLEVFRFFVGLVVILCCLFPPLFYCFHFYFVV